MCPTGSTLQITRRDYRPRWIISPLPLNAERRLPRATVLVATATIRVVATEGQIYGRQLQQAGDYTGPHRDPLTGLRARSPTDAGVPIRSGQALAPDEQQERRPELLMPVLSSPGRSEICRSMRACCA